jgi:hypothetical protein
MLEVRAPRGLGVVHSRRTGDYERGPLFLPLAIKQPNSVAVVIQRYKMSYSSRGIHEPIYTAMSQVDFQSTWVVHIDTSDLCGLVPDLHQPHVTTVAT